MKHTTEHSKHSTDIHEHLFTLYNLVIELQAKKVLELGVNTGESTIALLEAVAATDGKLISVDINDLPNTRAMLEGYGLAGRWDFRIMDDLKFGAEWPQDQKFDLIFIDTSHKYEHTKKEIELFEPLLRPGGVMVFHDTVAFYGGVQRPINQFRNGKKGWAYKNSKNCNGLGILRKP